ncbi:MAG: putative lipid II flippase FtsW [Bdellovibrio sp.]|nr:putative lipid II flippase FtsW [Bdellovibrio sp.]
MTILRNWFHNYSRRIRNRLRPLPKGGKAEGRSIDVFLLLTVLGLVLFGLIMVYSSSFIYAQEKTGDGFSFIRKQIVYAGLGLIALWCGSRIHYNRWKIWAYPSLGVVFLLLISIFIPGVGDRIGGARRWLHLGPFNFQPGELAKFVVIAFVARQLVVKQYLESVSKTILSALVAPLPVVLLLLLQPDFGTTVIISAVIFAMMFLSGLPARNLGVFLGVATLLGSWLVLGTAYRRNRVATFLDPWSDPTGKGFQIIQSFVGLHNGGIWGVGLGSGKEKLLFLPEAHNDFIFSVIGEELGFVGIFGVVIAYLLLIHRGLKTAWNSHLKYQDRFGMLLAAGITLAIGFQGLVNISVVMGILPTKGLTLPFISYGGSALLVDLFALGVLLNIGKGPLQGEAQANRLMPDENET